MLFHRPRWRSPGSTGSSRSFDNRKGGHCAKATPAAEVVPEGYESPKPAATSAETLPEVSAEMLKPKTETVLPAPQTSSEHGGLGGERVCPAEQVREKNVERARYDETIGREKDTNIARKPRNDDTQLIKERRRRPLYPPMPPIPPAPRPRAGCTGTAPCTTFVGSGQKENDIVSVPIVNMTAQDTFSLTLPSHRTAEGTGSKGYDTSPLLPNHRGKDGEQRLHGTTRNEAGEASNGHGWATTGDPSDDRFVLPFLRSIAKKQDEEDEEETDGEGEDEDGSQTVGSRSETKAVREGDVMMPSAEEIAKGQRPKQAMDSGGPRSALCVAEHTAVC